jgi:hypothetical protein
VAGRVPQGGEVGAHGQQAGEQQQPRAAQQVAEVAVAQGMDEFADVEQRCGQQEIVGNLRVVGADFERCAEGCDGRAEPFVAAQRHPDAPHHQRGIDERPHLGDMARADNQEEVGRKAVGQRRDDAHPRIDADDEQHEPHREHGEKDESGGFADEGDELSHRGFDELCGVGDIDQVGGHPSEHAPRPLGVFARIGAFEQDVARHAFVLLHVVLREHLAPELGGEIECADAEEDRQGRRQRQQPREQVVA